MPGAKAGGDDSRLPEAAAECRTPGAEAEGENSHLPEGAAEAGGVEGHTACGKAGGEDTRLAVAAAEAGGFACYMPGAEAGGETRCLPEALAEAGGVPRHTQGATHKTGGEDSHTPERRLLDATAKAVSVHDSPEDVPNASISEASSSTNPLAEQAKSQSGTVADAELVEANLVERSAWRLALLLHQLKTGQPWEKVLKLLADKRSS